MLLSDDLAGIPDRALLFHLTRSQRIYGIPSLLTALGLYLLATAYGIDVDERTDCKLKWAGISIAPLFPIIVCGFAAALRRRRAVLNRTTEAGERGLHLRASGLHLGRSWITPWVDRIPLFASDLKALEASFNEASLKA